MTATVQSIPTLIGLLTTTQEQLTQTEQNLTNRQENAKTCKGFLHNNFNAFWYGETTEGLRGRITELKGIAQNIQDMIDELAAPIKKTLATEKKTLDRLEREARDLKGRIEESEKLLARRIKNGEVLKIANTPEGKLQKNRNDLSAKIEQIDAVRERIAALNAKIGGSE